MEEALSPIKDILAGTREKVAGYTASLSQANAAYAFAA